MAKGHSRRRESEHMKHIGCLWIVGFFGWLAAANAQTASPPTASTQFDGKYAFVSSAKVNETYTTLGAGRFLQCDDRIAGPLSIANDQARYSGFGLRRTAEFEGTVGPNGQLTMRSLEPPRRYPSPGALLMVSGRIDANGIVHARQIGYDCSYDLIWQKQ
jgi:hypothetical protein